MEAQQTTTTRRDLRSPEVKEASRGLTPDQVISACRVVKRGETATDPGVARLAVAIATDQREHPVLMALPWVSVAAFLAIAVTRLLTGHHRLGDWLLLAIGLAVVPMTVMEIRRFVRLPQVQRKNRDLAATADVRMAADLALPPGPGPVFWRPADVLGLVIVAVPFSLLSVVADGRSVTVGAVALRAAVWVAGMTIVLPALMRWHAWSARRRAVRS